MPSKIIILRQRDGVKGFTLYSIRLSGSIDFGQWRAIAAQRTRADASIKGPGRQREKRPAGPQLPGAMEPEAPKPEGRGQGGPGGRRAAQRPARATQGRPQGARCNARAGLHRQTPPASGRRGRLQEPAGSARAQEPGGCPRGLIGRARRPAASECRGVGPGTGARVVGRRSPEPERPWARARIPWNVRVTPRTKCAGGPLAGLGPRTLAYKVCMALYLIIGQYSVTSGAECCGTLTKI